MKKRLGKGKKRAKSGCCALFERKELAWILGAGVIGVLSFFLLDSSVAGFFKEFELSWLSAFLSLFKPISIIVIFAALIAGVLWRKHRRNQIIPLGLALLLSYLASLALKLLIMRPRPFGLVEYITFTNLLDYSLPSSHATAVFSVLPSLEKLKWLNYLWIAFAFIIAFSRVYLGVHYLSDVIFGALLGYITGKLILGMKK